MLLGEIRDVALQFCGFTTGLEGTQQQCRSRITLALACTLCLNFLLYMWLLISEQQNIIQSRGKFRNKEFKRYIAEKVCYKNMGKVTLIYKLRDYNCHSCTMDQQSHTVQFTTIPKGQHQQDYLLIRVQLFMQFFEQVFCYTSMSLFSSNFFCDNNILVEYLYQSQNRSYGTNVLVYIVILQSCQSGSGVSELS